MEVQHEQAALSGIKMTKINLLLQNQLSQSSGSLKVIIIHIQGLFSLYSWRNTKPLGGHTLLREWKVMTSDMRKGRVVLIPYTISPPASKHLIKGPAMKSYRNLYNPSHFFLSAKLVVKSTAINNSTQEESSSFIKWKSR